MAATLSQNLLLTVPLAPLAGALIAGLAGKAVGRRGAHTVTIASVAISLAASLVLLKEVSAGNSFSAPLYTWLSGQGWSLHVTPGEEVLLVRQGGKASVQPFAVARKLADGSLNREDWQRQCSEAGIADMPLGQG